MAVAVFTKETEMLTKLKNKFEKKRERLIKYNFCGLADSAIAHVENKLKIIDKIFSVTKSVSSYLTAVKSYDRTNGIIAETITANLELVAKMQNAPEEERAQLAAMIASREKSTSLAFDDNVTFTPLLRNSRDQILHNADIGSMLSLIERNPKLRKLGEQVANDTVEILDSPWAKV